MPGSRPEDETVHIQNLDDLIEARQERVSAISDDKDGMADVESTDVDVDEALTFPHPKKKQTMPDVVLMDTPNEEDVEFGYEDSVEEMLPTEYTNDYNEELTTHFADENDDVVEEAVDELGDLGTDDLIYNAQSIDLPEQGGPRGFEEDRTEE